MSEKLESLWKNYVVELDYTMSFFDTFVNDSYRTAPLKYPAVKNRWMKTIKNLILFALLLVVVDSHAQDHKRTAIWYFGQNAGLDFNTDPPTVLTDGQINTDEGCAALCDTNGNLLLYTDGMTVWNGNHQIIGNGTGLLGNGSSSQGVIIIPQPDNDSIFFIFTTEDRGGSNGLNYSIVNIRGNNNLGEVIQKNNQLITPVTEAIAAVYHGNGKDIWIVSHGYGNNIFYSYLLTSIGIIKCPVISYAGNPISGNPALAQTAMKIASKGNTLAITFYASIQGKVELHQLNCYTGKIENAFSIPGVILPIGIEFSSNEQYLYVVERDNSVYQFDLTENTNQGISDSRINIFPYTNNSKFALQRAKNSEIYLAIKDSFSLTRIKYPDLHDTAVGLQFQGQLISGKAKVGLPNFVSSYFHRPSVSFKYDLNCSDNSISITEYDTFGANTFQWEIKKLSASITESVSSDKNPNFQFQDTGWYTIKLIASNGTLTDSVSKDIHIKSKFILNLGSDTTICQGATLVLDAGTGQHCYRWQDGSEGSAFLADTQGVYWVKVTSNNFCAYYNTIKVSCSGNPSKPQITRSYDTLFTSYSNSLQWYRNASLIAGENDSFIKITLNGFYQVSVKNGFGCETLSDSFSVTNVSIGSSIQAEQAFRLFPNPSQGQLFIEPKEKLDLVYDVQILTVSGIEIFHSENRIGTSEINTHSFSPGLYMLKIITKENIYLSKIIIQSPN